MPDTIQLGTFTDPTGRYSDQSGRFQMLLDLNDGVNFSVVRDTLNIAPLQGANQIFAKSGRRYGGSKQVGETHDNGLFEAEWYINSAAHTMDASLQQFDKLAGYLQDASGGPYFIRYSPDGATKFAYLELRGSPPYEPMWKWIEYQSTKTLHVKASAQIAPLAKGDPMDIYDNFTVDTLSDYTFESGAGTLTWTTQATVAMTSTAQKAFWHSARGYTAPDSQNTLRFKTGASAAGVIRTRDTILDANNYVYAELAGGQIRVGKSDGGTPTTLAFATYALSATTDYSLRLRKEGNVLIAEVFTTSPTPVATPAATATYTLTGADATKFGAGVGGSDGVAITPVATDWLIRGFSCEPYTYRNKTLPGTFDIVGVPGTAPAQADVYLYPSAPSAAPAWALIGWSKTPNANTASLAPLGLAEEETSASTLNFTPTADASARGGSAQQLTMSGAGTGYVAISIDPTRVPPDDWSREEVAVEIWAHISKLPSTAISPIFTLSTYQSLNNSAIRYSAEYGSLGKAIVPPSSGTVARFVRLGTITLPTTRDFGSSTWNLRIDAAWGAGSSGALALDYVMAVPARQRALLPTGKVNDGNYPKFLLSTSAGKIVRSDLRGYYVASHTGVGPSRAYDTGMGGNLIEPPPGNVTWLVKLSNLVPDDPTVDTTTEGLSVTTALHFGITPRYHMMRSS